MRSTVYKLILFIVLIGLISCEKNPIEIVTGRWQLTSIEGSDTTRGNHNEILKIINLSFSAGRTSSWHNDPFSIKPSFYLWPYEVYNYFLPNQSLIFLHGSDPLLFTEDDISKLRLILHNFSGHDKITYTFKKL